ncbi:hypothetical protein DFH08DRAFT_1074044 [Mycena albidolilacea]|uniref:Uncharacterized protein n=1 Tax=Mycena albidolilacea TaxID=1033008 RepID=A0AAD7F1J1_9AGAR|nr:hypothetical protein DFH08DRAFT_1074044 [Mycena albidolilacea]
MSFRKDRVRLFGLIRARDGISEDEFRTRMIELLNAIKLLPSQSHVLKYEMAFRTSAGEQELKDTLKHKADSGFSSVVLMEAEDNEELMKAIRDPVFLKLLDDGHETFMMHDRLEVFMTEVFSVI